MPAVPGSHSRVQPSITPAPAEVLALGDWLEMVRVHALTAAAEMIELQALGNRAYEVLIRPAVRDSHPAEAHPKLAVAVGGERACPDPAPAILVIDGGDLVEEPIQRRSRQCMCRNAVLGRLVRRSVFAL